MIYDAETRAAVKDYVRKVEDEARRLYPEGAAVVAASIANHSICDGGRLIAWRAARRVQIAIEEARNAAAR